MKEQKAKQRAAGGQTSLWAVLVKLGFAEPLGLEEGPWEMSWAKGRPGGLSLGRGPHPSAPQGHSLDLLCA